MSFLATLWIMGIICLSLFCLIHMVFIEPRLIQCDKCLKKKSKKHYEYGEVRYWQDNSTIVSARCDMCYIKPIGIVMPSEGRLLSFSRGRISDPNYKHDKVIRIIGRKQDE